MKSTASEVKFLRSGVNGEVYGINKLCILQIFSYDIKYLQDVKYEYHDCSILFDRDYIRTEVQNRLVRNR